MTKTKEQLRLEWGAKRYSAALSKVTRHYVIECNDDVEELARKSPDAAELLIVFLAANV